MLRSTDINNTEDKGEYYHLIFNMYDYETLLPRSYNLTIRMFEEMHFEYVLMKLGDNLTETGLLNECAFFMVADMSFDRKNFHLKIPNIPSNINVINTFKENIYSYEVFVEEISGMVRLVMVIIDNRLRRANKLKKIKNKIKYEYFNT